MQSRKRTDIPSQIPRPVRELRLMAQLAINCPGRPCATGSTVRPIRGQGFQTRFGARYCDDKESRIGATNLLTYPAHVIGDSCGSASAQLSFQWGFLGKRCGCYSQRRLTHSMNWYGRFIATLLPMAEVPCFLKTSVETLSGSIVFCFFTKMPETAQVERIEKVKSPDGSIKLKDASGKMQDVTLLISQFRLNAPRDCSLFLLATFSIFKSKKFFNVEHKFRRFQR